MARKITLITGDGIGPEVTSSVLRVLEAAGVKVEWERLKAGAEAVAQSGEPVPESLIESLRRNRVGLKGPLSTPVGSGFRSVNVALRKELDLYVNFRPVRSLPGVDSRFGEVDLVVFRENTEGLYSGLEHEVVPGVVESLKVITERASTRISRYAFQYARREGRRQIACVHKANIMKLSDGLFLRSARQVAQEFPEIAYQEVIVDNTCMQLVINPRQFDVLLMENLYGDIVSDLCAGLVGGLGIVPAANIGERGALFEAVHGTAPDIAGKNLANPTALLQSAVLMLQYIEERAAAGRIERALRRVYAEKYALTRDVGGRATTGEFTDAVIEAL